MRKLAVWLCAAVCTVAFAKSHNLFSVKLGKNERLVHALNRLTFGPRPGDVESVRAMGLQRWAERQLHPESVPENPVLAEKLRPLDTLTMSPAEMARNYPPQNKNRVQVARELAAAKLYRAVYSNRQLQEVLADFWFNHFNVFLEKGADFYLVTAYERDAIRPHIFARFRELLEATAKSPAMLFYLDNWQSGGRRGLNENYGRELLELHSLGVDGGYTQKDVIETARCFTGWTIKDLRRGGEFEFNPRMHDSGPKIVLGVAIPAGGGIEDGERVLDIVARHPSTARFISRKLAVRFVADEPPQPLVNRMAETFRKTDGDLRAVMKAMFDSKEFWSQGAYRAKIKSPLEMVASAVRAVNGDVDSTGPLSGQIAQLGQPLYRKLEPTGYSNTGAAWLNSAGLLARMNFALALAGNHVPGVKVDGAQVSGVTLGSPEFQRR